MSVTLIIIIRPLANSLIKMKKKRDALDFLTFDFPFSRSWDKVFFEKVCKNLYYLLMYKVPYLDHWTESIIQIFYSRKFHQNFAHWGYWTVIYNKLLRSYWFESIIQILYSRKFHQNFAHWGYWTVIYNKLLRSYWFDMSK